MSRPFLHHCRGCDGLITDPDDAVFLWHEEAVSGPGWEVWAHRDHVDQVDTINDTLLRIMTRIWEAQQNQAPDA